MENSGEVQNTTIWRMHIRPKDVDPELSFAVCQKQKILGLGWSIDVQHWRGLTWPKYRAYATRRYHGNLSAPRLLAEEVKVGDLIWTRDAKNVYFLARVVSPWAFIGKQENYDADIVNTVRVQMFKVGIESHVPGKVVAAFRPSRTLQRIIDRTIAAFSKYRFNRLSRSDTYRDMRGRCDVFSLLSDGDCEDIVYVYLQTRGYVVFPSSRNHDTQKYEYVLVHRKSGQEAIAQVKTGHVPIRVDKQNWPPLTRVYVFSSTGTYEGKVGRNVKVLTRRCILDFMRGNRKLLPTAVTTWMEMADNGDVTGDSCTSGR